MDGLFDRPLLDSRKTPEENIAVLDRWADELVIKLNLLAAKMGQENNGERTD